jgi:hypothetical protein
MEIDEPKMVHWLDYFGIAYDYEAKGKDKIFVRRQVSGHPSRSELYELIEKIASSKSSLSTQLNQTCLKQCLNKK